MGGVISLDPTTAVDQPMNIILTRVWAFAIQVDVLISMFGATGLLGLRIAAACYSTRHGKASPSSGFAEPLIRVTIEMKSGPTIFGGRFRVFMHGHYLFLLSPT